MPHVSHRPHVAHLASHRPRPRPPQYYKLKGKIVSGLASVGGGGWGWDVSVRERQQAEPSWPCIEVSAPSDLFSCQACRVQEKVPFFGLGRGECFYFQCLGPSWDTGRVIFTGHLCHAYAAERLAFCEGQDEKPARCPC